MFYVIQNCMSFVQNSLLIKYFLGCSRGGLAYILEKFLCRKGCEALEQVAEGSGSV